MRRQTVLVLTQPFDFTADCVIRKLYAREVDVVRFDTAWFPREASLVAQLGRRSPEQHMMLTSEIGKSVDLSCIASVWYRRPRDFAFDDKLDHDATQFARNEALHGFGGVLRSITCSWVNHPEKEVSASYKPFQLTTASQIGLKIPRTLITNDPDTAREFIKTNTTGTIYKTLSFPEITSKVYERSTVFTTLVSNEDLSGLDAVKYTPCLLQEYIPKSFEVRVTIIRNRVFAVALRAPYQDVVDWRPVTDDLKYSVHELPAWVEDRCVRLVRRLGLSFGAIDFVVTPDNDYVFLEINPSGQWAWLEDETGLPIADALADCLAPFSQQTQRGKQ